MSKEQDVKHAPDVRGARILVIEDNASDVFLLNRALNQQDFQFELVPLPTGDEALAFIRGQGASAGAAIPDLILVDLNLAKYTGEDILREIRSAPHLSGIPVCVWSSSRSRRDEALLHDLDVTRFITKPSGLGQFMEIGRIIKDLLAGRSFGTALRISRLAGGGSEDQAPAALPASACGRVRAQRAKR